MFVCFEGWRKEEGEKFWKKKKGRGGQIRRGTNKTESAGRKLERAGGSNFSETEKSDTSIRWRSLEPQGWDQDCWGEGKMVGSLRREQQGGVKPGQEQPQGRTTNMHKQAVSTRKMNKARKLLDFPLPWGDVITWDQGPWYRGDNWRNKSHAGRKSSSNSTKPVGSGLRISVWPQANQFPSLGLKFSAFEADISISKQNKFYLTHLPLVDFKSNF